jgi:glycerophosphodiester phosphodiesterase
MKLIGHRGVGAEKYAQATPTLTRRTHIQENTVLSFVTASKSGADFIEFDVQVKRNEMPLSFPPHFHFFWTQVTRDGHPVIHHDVAVDLGGVRIPVVSLTLQEFLVIRDANHSSQQQHVASAPTDEASSRHRNRSLSPRSRGKSDEGMLFARFEILAVLPIASNADFVL